MAIQVRTILLVEDDALIAINEKMLLEQYGYSVVAVNSGERAVACLEGRHDVDLVLMDIDLGPGIDGTEAATRILRTREIPIVFLSSHTEPAVVRKTEAITSYGYVVKNSGITVLDASIKMAFKLFEAETKANAINTKLESTLDALPDLMFEVGLDGTYFDFHSHRNELLWLPPSELLGRKIPDVLPSSVSRILMSAIEEAHERGSSAGRQYELAVPAGLLWFEVSVSALGLDPANPHFIVLARNITERKNAELALYASESKYRNLFDNAEVGMFRTRLDGSEVLEFNRKYLSMLGMSHEDCVGKPSYKLWADPAEREAMVEILKRELHVDDYECRLRRMDGREIDCITSLRLFPEQGILEGSIIDVTDRKKAEESLLVSEEMYRNLHESAGLGISYYEIDGRVISYNRLAAGNMGGKPEDFRGKSIYEIFPRSDAEFYHQRIVRAANSKDPEVYEDLVPLPSVDRHFISTFTRLVDAGSKILGVQIISQDITDLKRAEEAALKNHHELEQSQKIARVGSWTYDARTRRHEWSAEMFRIWGLDPKGEAPSFAERRKQVHPDDLGIFDAAIDAAVKHARPYDLDLRIVTADGTGRNLHTMCEAVVGPDGKPTGLRGVTQDITEWVAKEAELRSSEERFRTAVEESPFPIMIHAEDGKVEVINRTWTDLTGYSIHDIPTTSDWAEKAYGIKKLEVKQEIDALYSIRERKQEGEYQVRTASGDILTWDFGSAPLGRLPDGRRAVISMAKDTTERKRMEQKLRESEERLALVLEASELGYWDCDLSTNRVIRNERWASMLGYTIEELRPTREQMAELLAPEEAGQIWQLAQDHIEGKISHYRARHRMRAKDGSYRWILDCGQVVKRDSEGRPLRGCGTHRDITEEVENENRIKALLAEKDLILREVHHRIKNTLGTIKSLVFLQKASLKDAPSVSAFESTERRIDAMMLLYERLYSSASFSRMPLKDYLSTLVEQVVSTFPISESVSVEQHYDDFELDTKRLQPLGIIINEIVTNMMKHAFAGRSEGRITATGSLSGGIVTISIQDDGVGLPESVGFDRSSGFGLTLVSGLAGQLDGRIAIERGKGTRFVLEFAK
jgi:PAS domain S-box-containing protein